VPLGLGLGGFLRKLGALDSRRTVVHINAGIAALACVWLFLGKRRVIRTKSRRRTICTSPSSARLVMVRLVWFQRRQRAVRQWLAASAFVVTHVGAAVAG
jgi:ammonia channel protein AmtB